MAKRKKKLANLPSKQAVEDKLRPGPGVQRMGGGFPRSVLAQDGKKAAARCKR